MITDNNRCGFPPFLLFALAHCTLVHILFLYGLAANTLHTFRLSLLQGASGRRTQPPRCRDLHEPREQPEPCRLHHEHPLGGACLLVPLSLSLSVCLSLSVSLCLSLIGWLSVCFRVAYLSMSISYRADYMTITCALNECLSRFTIHCPGNHWCRHTQHQDGTPEFD